MVIPSGRIPFINRNPVILSKHYPVHHAKRGLTPFLTVFDIFAGVCRIEVDKK